MVSVQLFAYFAQVVDDIDIRLMNLQYLRSHIGLVTQEPTLFDCSIKENIIYGLENAESLPADVLFNRVVEAAKTANIHDFVENLPQVRQYSETQSYFYIPHTHYTLH